MVGNLKFEKKKNVRGEIQFSEKSFAKQILEKEGFDEKQFFFEMMFRGSRTDILAESKNKTILVECCSCRIDKIRDYLLEPKTEVWVIIRDEFSKIYKFKRGNNWNLVEEFEQKKLQKLKTIQSPLDNL